VSSYPAAGGPVCVFADEGNLPAGVRVAVRLADLLDGRFVKGERERLLTAAFMIRVLVLMTLMPDAQVSDVIAALAGDLALVPWRKPRRPASERACSDWRKALGAAPLEELRAAVLASAREEHAACPGQCLVTGRSRPLSVHSADGSLLRVPDTPANRAAFGSVSWPEFQILLSCHIHVACRFPFRLYAYCSPATAPGTLTPVRRAGRPTTQCGGPPGVPCAGSRGTRTRSAGLSS
jgi:hypothetical protein